MTAQLPELLHYKGKPHALCTTPLESHPKIAQIRASLHDVHSHTACERRYVGIWKVIEGRLYLDGMKTVRGDDLPVKDFFNSQNFPLLASWFSGELRCPKGELLKYVHFGFGSVYEQDLIISVKSGVVESERVNTNQIPPPRDPDEANDLPEFLLKKL
jgi:hypothetical protein